MGRLTLMFIALALVACASGATPEAAVSRPTLQILDKPFRVIRLTERPRAMELLACWQAPDGTLVFVDYLGAFDPIDEDALWLSSAPPMARQDLLALLLLDNNTPPHSRTACERLAQAERDR